MTIDEKYLNDLMYLLAASNDSTDMDEEDVARVKSRIPVVLQQGRAILSKRRKSLDTKFDDGDDATWRDFV